MIGEPTDLIRIFAEVKTGRRHLWLGLRNLLSYLEVAGMDSGQLLALRRALPKVSCGLDVKIPSESMIAESLKKADTLSLKYAAVFHLLLDSGLRLAEAESLVNNFKYAEQVGRFYRHDIGIFRGTKQAYYAYFTEGTRRLLETNREQVNARSVTTYFRKKKLVNPKYLRKFAFYKMIELEVPESVADYVEGRVAKRIGARHYMAMTRQADNFYKRYGEYVERLRDGVSLSTGQVDSEEKDW